MLHNIQLYDRKRKQIDFLRFFLCKIFYIYSFENVSYFFFGCLYGRNKIFLFLSFQFLLLLLHFLLVYIQNEFESQLFVSIFIGIFEKLTCFLFIYFIGCVLGLVFIEEAPCFQLKIIFVHGLATFACLKFGFFCFSISFIMAGRDVITIA